VLNARSAAAAEGKILSESSTSSAAIDIATALATLDATPATLDQDQRARLDEDGYLVLPGALRESEVALLRKKVDELNALERDRTETGLRQEPGAARLVNLVDEGPLFDLCWNNPVQLAAVAHVLSWHEFKLSSLNGRAALPGHGRQALHADWGEGVQPGDYQVCNSIWMLDDFTPDNGATRAVPGSHRRGHHVKDVVDDPLTSHPDEVLLTGTAGTCVVFNSHVWHGGTENKTGSPRRALHGYFCRREHTQQQVQREHLRPETLARLSPVQRYLLEV
jgi:ectoine hydroxylase-related dioxygenase (phytanoyl-CoA dioxygenase family)